MVRHGTVPQLLACLHPSPNMGRLDGTHQVHKADLLGPSGLEPDRFGSALERFVQWVLPSNHRDCHHEHHQRNW